MRKMSRWTSDDNDEEGGVVVERGRWNTEREERKSKVSGRVGDDIRSTTRPK
jgi:hypothetical protein